MKWGIHMKKKCILVVVIVLGLILIFLSILGVKKYNIIKEIIQKSDEYCNKENVYHKISATDSSLAYVELFKNKEKEKIEKNNKKLQMYLKIKKKKKLLLKKMKIKQNSYSILQQMDTKHILKILMVK